MTASQHVNSGFNYIKVRLRETMSQIKTLIFSMDGVIIYREPAHMKIKQKIFSELGLDISSKEHH